MNTYGQGSSEIVPQANVVAIMATAARPPTSISRLRLRMSLSRKQVPTIPIQMMSRKPTGWFSPIVTSIAWTAATPTANRCS